LKTTVQNLHEELIINIHSDLIAMYGTRRLSENMSRLSKLSALD